MALGEREAGDEASGAVLGGGPPRVVSLCYKQGALETDRGFRAAAEASLAAPEVSKSLSSW